MADNNLTDRQRNFRLLWLYIAVSLVFINMFGCYRDQLMEDFLRDGQSVKEVVESLEYNTNKGMVGVFLGWVCFFCILFVTYHEPKISNTLLEWLRKIRKVRVNEMNSKGGG